jgi:hypothetical protein
MHTSRRLRLERSTDDVTPGQFTVWPSSTGTGR